MRVALVLLVTLATACLPRYRYGSPRVPTSGADPIQACYESNQLELVTGSASWSEQYQRGDYLVTNRYGQDGLAFYRGGRRLDLRLALADLDDPELAAAYDRILARSAHDARLYPRYRDASFGMAFGGLAIALATLAVVADDPDHASYAAAGTASGVAAGLAILSIIPAVLAYRTHDGAVEHDVARHLVTDPNLADRAEASVAAHNGRVAASCGAASR